MKKAPKLSVIIVTFNSAPFILSCIQSLYESGYPHNHLQIIVVDNASSDATVSMVRRNFPKVLCLANKKNRGFAAANNSGIKKSQGEYVLVLNPDTVVAKDTIPRMVYFMQHNKTAGVATCKVVLPSGVLDDACHRGFPTPINSFFHFTGIASLFPKSQFFNGYHLGYKNLDITHEIDSCVGAFMFIKRSAGLKVGWFDEDYFWYGEDIDFCYRVKKAGWKVYYIPDCTVIHFKGASSGLKKHSAHITSATKAIKLQAMTARFDVMETFYKKHYKHVYPYWSTWMVLSGIKLKRLLSMLSINF